MKILRLCLFIAVWGLLFAQENKDKLIQCLKLKLQYPQINIDCEQLLGLSSPKLPSKTNIQSPIPEPKEEKTVVQPSNFDEGKQEAPLIKKDDNEEVINILSTRISENYQKISRLENLVGTVSKTFKLLGEEISNLKKSIESDKDLLNKNKAKNADVTSSPPKNKPAQSIKLRKNKKVFYTPPTNNDIQSQIEMLMNKKKLIKSKRQLSKSKSSRQTEPTLNNNQNLDYNILQQLLNKPKAVPELAESKPSDLQNQNLSQRKPMSLEEINGLLLNEPKKEELQIVDKKEEVIQQKHHNALDSEASKLFETFASLKNQQKGFLNNMMSKENSKKRMSNPQPKKANPNANVQAETNVLNSSDSTLGEIEKQISLLNSLNSNNQ